jgi:hypothetical protein
VTLLACTVYDGLAAVQGIRIMTIIRKYIFIAFLVYIKKRRRHSVAHAY